MKYLKMKGALALLFLAGSQLTAHGFTHPGVAFSTYDLERMKANRTVQPWKMNYDALAADGRASLAYTMQGPFANVGREPDANLGAYRNDSLSVLYLSLQWYFTGDTAYASKAMGILNAWTTTHATWSGTTPFLAATDYGAQLIMGAEILRYTYPGWTTAMSTNCQNYFTNMLWAQTYLPGPVRSANQGAAQIKLGMMVAVFCNDNARFGQVLDAWHQYACAGLSNSLPTGQVGDSGRDQGHALGQISNTAMTAETAWKQGVDLYGELGNRLLAEAEFFAQVNLGNAVPFTTFGTCYDLYASHGPGISATLSAHTVLELVRGAYVIRKGMAAPYTEQYLANIVTTKVNVEDFFYRKDGSTTPTPPPNPPQPVVEPAYIAPPLATSLTSVDVGSVAEPGSSTYSNGTWTVVGSGADIWDLSADSFRFAYKQLTGNGTIVARVTGLTQSNVYAKAGLMIRESLATNSRLVLLAEKATTATDGGAEFFARNTPGGAPASFQPHNVGTIPYWLKLVRNGDLITGYTSPDGINWTAIQMVNLPMSQTVYIGLAVCGHNNVVGGSATATFTNVAMDTNGGLIKDGIYRITNRNSGKGMRVFQNQLSRGAPVVQWDYAGGMNEWWNLTDIGGGRYRMIGVASAKALDVTGNVATDGAEMETWDYRTGSLNQQFTLAPTTSGYFRITPVNSGKCVEVGSADTVNYDSATGAGGINQWTYSGGNHQQWLFQAP